MTPIIILLSILIPSKQGRINSGMDLGTGYGGTVCGFHTRPVNAVTILKFHLLKKGFTIQKCVQKMQMDWHTIIILIRLVSVILVYSV